MSKPGGYDKAAKRGSENDSNRGNGGHSEGRLVNALELMYALFFFPTNFTVFLHKWEGQTTAPDKTGRTPAQQREDETKGREPAMTTRDH
jgi:hypothetical protein